MTQSDARPRSTAMATPAPHATDRRIRLLIGLIAAVVLIGAGVNYVLQQVVGQNRTTAFTLTALEVSTRSAKIEIVHPRNGKTITLPVEVPVDCEIFIDDKPAAIDAIRVGDRGTAEGMIYRSGRLVAKRVAVTRSAATSATAPAGGGSD